MRYYLTLSTQARIHYTHTSLHPEHIIQVDLGREETFDLYYSLETLPLSKSDKEAYEIAIKIHQTTPPPFSSAGLVTLFSTETKSISKDPTLTDIYGDNCVFTRLIPIPITFQVEGTFKENEVKKDKYGRLLVKRIEAQIQLNFALIGNIVLHCSDNFAKKNNRKLTMHLIDHYALTNKLSIAALSTKVRNTMLV